MRRPTEPRSRTLEDLRDADPLARPLLVGLLAVSLMQSVAYDLGRYDGGGRTMLAAAGAVLAQAAVYLAVAGIASRVRVRLRPWLGAVAYTMSAAVKAVLLVAMVGSPDPTAELALRLPGDLTFAAVLWTAVAVVVGTRTRHAATLVALRSARSELDRRRAGRTAAARGIDERLRRQAADALSAELSGIAAALRTTPGPDPGDDTGIAALRRIPSDLDALIERRVRPLARSLSAHADLVERLVPDDGPEEVLRAPTAVRVDPRCDLRVTGPYLVASVNVLLTVAQLSSWEVALAVQAASVGVWLVMVGLRAVWPRTRTVGWLGLSNLVALGTGVGHVPALLVLERAQVAHPDLGPVRLTAWGAQVLVMSSVAGWHALRRARDERLEEIARVNEEVDRELALLDQAAWVAQRRWSTLIHGSVQGALTVARSRLLSAERLTPEVLARARADVERAEQTLAGPTRSEAPARELLDEVAAAWEGLCAVRYDLAPEVLAAVDRDPTSVTCLIEIVKELVGNAHRHGGATRVDVVGRLEGERELGLECRDDGRGVPERAEPGLGFAVFDELTRWWTLGPADAGFRAAVPLG